MGEYRTAAISDAADMAIEFIDQIIGQLLNGKASDDILNDYADGDSYHHENHVDNKADRLLEAAKILDELSEFEETDSGLWEGREPRQAVKTQAAYTYGNAVLSLWSNLIRKINEDGDVAEMHEIQETLDFFDEDEVDDLKQKVQEMLGDYYDGEDNIDQAKNGIRESMTETVKELIENWKK